MDGAKSKEIKLQIIISVLEPSLFEVSIRKNLLFGMQDDDWTKYSDEELDTRVYDALKAANAWEFVKNLPKGIHTNVSGGTLSGGQKCVYFSRFLPATF